MPAGQHHDQIVQSVACAVITVSDTRTPDTDKSGSLIRRRLVDAGHSVVSYDILPDDPQRVRNRVLALCCEPQCDAILLTGGTGLSAHDTTFEAVDAILEKRLDGFGELFRALSYEQIGPAAMLSRAVAGTRNGKAIFVMPGSEAAVSLAMEKLILPELGHIVWLVGNRRSGVVA